MEYKNYKKEKEKKRKKRKKKRRPTLGTNCTIQITALANSITMHALNKAQSLCSKTKDSLIVSRKAQHSAFGTATTVVADRRKRTSKRGRKGSFLCLLRLHDHVQSRSRAKTEELKECVSHAALPTLMERAFI